MRLTRKTLANLFDKVQYIRRDNEPVPDFITSNHTTSDLDTCRADDLVLMLMDEEGIITEEFTLQEILDAEIRGDHTLAVVQNGEIYSLTFGTFNPIKLI